MFQQEGFNAFPCNFKGELKTLNSGISEKGVGPLSLMKKALFSGLIEAI
jgi:hypothetical protein